MILYKVRGTQDPNTDSKWADRSSEVTLIKEMVMARDKSRISQQEQFEEQQQVLLTGIIYGLSGLNTETTLPSPALNRCLLGMVIHLKI